MGSKWLLPCDCIGFIPTMGQFCEVFWKSVLLGRTFPSCYFSCGGVTALGDWWDRLSSVDETNILSPELGEMLPTSPS